MVNNEAYSDFEQYGTKINRDLNIKSTSKKDQVKKYIAYREANPNQALRVSKVKSE